VTLIFLFLLHLAKVYYLDMGGLSLSKSAETPLFPNGEEVFSFEFYEIDRIS